MVGCAICWQNCQYLKALYCTLILFSIPPPTVHLFPLLFNKRSLAFHISQIFHLFPGFFARIFSSIFASFQTKMKSISISEWSFCCSFFLFTREYFSRDVFWQKYLWKWETVCRIWMLAESIVRKFAIFCKIVQYWNKNLCRICDIMDVYTKDPTRILVMTISCVRSI
jgi:hypothetical protein